MTEGREKGGEHVTFLFRLLTMLIEKTPEGGATVGDIQNLYEAAKGSPPSEKIIQRAIHRLNYIFDPNSADEDAMFRTPRNQLPVRSASTTMGGERIRRFTFHHSLAADKEAGSEKAAQALFQIYPQQRQMQTEDFEKLFDLLASNLGYKDSGGGQLRNNIEQFVFVSGFTPAESRNNLQSMVRIFQAFRKKKRVRFQYTSASTGEKTAAREVDPYGLISRHGVWYLVGHCHNQNSVRIFRIDHIARLTIVENSTYKVPADYSLVRKYGSLWGIWTESEKPPGTELVRLHVAAPIASHFDTVRYHSSQTVRKNSDGSLEVCFNVGGAREMVPWLMGWAEHVKVLEPAWLRDEVVESAKRLLQQYE